ncbi:hypothetical protein D0867_11637 [Hortaea werneckii]|uniref:Transcription factor domain-containing protein n=1 Tax=Hortaea werneckii TaxID=91943 RepID=A0A3M6YCG4_HORWE|nr:hypothetical protein D0867_11637 [Hortaea werneckii]RMY33276.1 hypothetical protein D0866_06040 [Hortaea werneckii]
MCSTRQRSCQYEAEQGESRQKALKRKHDHLEASHNELSDFVTCLARQDNSTVLDVMRKVRTGGDIGDLLQSLRSRTASRGTSIDSGRREKQILLLSNLMQGTDALPEIMHFLEAFVNDMLWTREFYEIDLDLLRNRLFNVRTLGRIIACSVPIHQISSPSTVHKSSLRQSTRQTMVLDESLDTPLVMLPAAPWTRITEDDLLVSRLVTIFLNYQNAYWRYVEADLFLQAMKLAQPPSDLCSPLLVNSVLAMASLSAEYRDVFFEADDYTSRGRQFHEEAMRLWASLRGKDKLGEEDMDSLVQAALNLREKLYDWYEGLSSDLKYDLRLPAFLHEIHCEYLCVRMTLASNLGARLQSQSSPSEPRSRGHHNAVEADVEHFQAAYWTSEAGDLALRAAKLLENYRSLHGLKFVLPFIFQTATTASFILLGHAPTENGRRSPDDRLHSIEAIEEPTSGLEESLRCLLGIATQVSIARGAALMLLKTAKIMKVKLPDSIMHLPQTVAEIAWGIKNDRSLSSSYPNYALVAAGGGRPEGLTMEELLNKWSNLSV